MFIIGPDKKIKATLTYPMSTGRNFTEILRLLDSCQLTANEQVATPANWQHGDDVIILPSVSNEEAAEEVPRWVGVATSLHPGCATTDLNARGAQRPGLRKPSIDVLLRRSGGSHGHRAWRSEAVSLGTAIRV